MEKPRRPGYWAERNRKRRLDPVYLEKQRILYKKWLEKHGEDPDYKKMQSDNQAKYRKDPKLRQRHIARWAINHRIQSGKIKREPCEICGNVEVEAHHPDYSMPLNVMWLCPKHHREIERAKATGKDK